MQDVVPFGQIFYCTARCKQGRDTITKKILLLGKRLNAKRDELGDSRPLGHREYYTKNIFRAPSSRRYIASTSFAVFTMSRTSLRQVRLGIGDKVGDGVRHVGDLILTHPQLVG